MSATPGRLLAAGRTADVYALDAARVLRRYRDGRDAGAEARMLTAVREAGFPVPEVLEAGGPDLVMQRVFGSSMLGDLRRRPWRTRHHGAQLADLHRQLRAIEATPGLPRVGSGGNALLHLDLHPGNVLFGPDGPVVIGWANAASGERSIDVAMTWLLISTYRPDGPVRGATLPLRAVLQATFLAGVHTAEVARGLRAAAALRSRDPAVGAEEREVVARAVRRFGADHRVRV